jgi:hypothetical protein
MVRVSLFIFVKVVTMMNFFVKTLHKMNKIQYRIAVVVTNKNITLALPMQIFM